MAGDEGDGQPDYSDNSDDEENQKRAIDPSQGLPVQQSGNESPGVQTEGGGQ